jgi:predicted PurR-regulated permease PerM
VRADAPLAPSSSRALWVLATLASVAFLKLAAQLLIPIVLGVLASLALEPVVAWLVQRRVPRAIAAAAVLALLLAGAAWGAYSLRDSLAEALESLPAAARRARQMLEAALASSQLDEASKALNGGSAAAAPGVMSGAASAARRFTGLAVAAMGHATVIVFLVFFLLQSGPRMARRLTEAAGTTSGRALVATILTDVNRQVQRFLLVTAFTAMVVAIVTSLVLWIMGVQYPIFWGVLAGVCNSIPYFGPVVVSGGLFVVGLVQQGDGRQAWQMAAAALVITSLEGWLLTPPLMGRAERMNVLSVFIGLLLWTWLWGAWGTLLAVPMLAVLKSVADHVASLRPLGRLMAA